MGGGTRLEAYGTTDLSSLVDQLKDAEKRGDAAGTAAAIALIDTATKGENQGGDDGQRI